jgi:cyclophilin family peptidyl-prolyl cis-trans isomerase
MYSRIRRCSLILAGLVASASLFSRIADATVVEFQTALGNFEVNLYDNATPATVANFLDYVNNGAYTNSIFHRSVNNFVVQGGGLSYGSNLSNIPTNAAVVNEPEYSNVRGTIAMAKTPSNPNSATSQWFFNLQNNSGSLDGQNGGFTVFGQVVGNGMDIIDAMAALPIYNFGGSISELPLRNYTATDFTNNVSPDDTHLVMVSAIVISDSTVNSAAGLSPVVNTANSPPPASDGGGGGGGGSLGIFTLLFLLLARRFRRA